MNMKNNMATIADSKRTISHRSNGHGQGIVRLMSPGGIGEMIKPFVFLDRFDVPPAAEDEIKSMVSDYYHPHSGLMTVTALISGNIYYEDTTGASGIIETGGIEYMIAGNGIWHSGASVGNNRSQGYQLWVALPPEFENAAPSMVVLAPEQIPAEECYRVILGSYGSLKSKVMPTLPMNYLQVHLKAGQSWVYQSPEDHNIAWVAPYNDGLVANGYKTGKEIIVFEEGNREIEFTAVSDCDFVIGSAFKHPHKLVLGNYSVHTSEATLIKGESEIARIRDKIKVLYGSGK